MLNAIKHRLDKCETWKQPHEDIEWLLARIAELEAQRDTLLMALDQRGCDGVVHECAIYERRAIELKQMLRFMMNEYDKRIGLWYINEEELTAIREALDET